MPNDGQNTGTPGTAVVQGPGTEVAPRNPSYFVEGHDPRRGRGIAGVGGRPSSFVRAAARLRFAERIEMLCMIADGAPLPFTRRYLAKEGKKLPDGTVCTKEQEEAGLIIEAKWEESADLDQRMKAINMLGNFGGLNVMVDEDPDGKDKQSDTEYAITFD